MSSKDWRTITYSVPIELKEVNKLNRKPKEFIVKGIAINETITRNNVKYTAEELSLSAHTLKDKPILKDHKNEVDSIVGRTRNTFFDQGNKSVMFEGVIKDPLTQEMIRDGRITNVSIGARVKDLVKEESEGQKYVVARGIEFLELSLVPVPGDANATISHALSEAFELKESEEHNDQSDEQSESDTKIQEIKEEKNMEENFTKEDFLALKKELDSIKEQRLREETLVKEAKEKEDFNSRVSQIVEELLAKEKPKQTTKGLVSEEQKAQDDEFVVEQITGGAFSIYKKPTMVGGN